MVFLEHLGFRVQYLGSVPGFSSDARVQAWSHGGSCNALSNPASVAFDSTNLTAPMNGSEPRRGFLLCLAAILESAREMKSTLQSSELTAGRAIAA